jgi:hypothetical protein
VAARLAEVARGEAVVGIGALNIGSLRRGLKLIAQICLQVVLKTQVLSR